MRFAKGHGTGNDFVIIEDVDGELKLDADLVRALCDRHTGIGADGVLRVVRSVHEPDADNSAEFFMDYRNSDGSTAEMCGNGARVFARYLVDTGLAEPGQWPISTRGGLRQVAIFPAGEVSVEMGPVVVSGSGTATVLGEKFTGARVSVGNPHLVCVIQRPVAELDLHLAPALSPVEFPTGANVEFVNLIGPSQARMRVYERGSGETLSCGTGACAVAAVVAAKLRGDVAAAKLPGDKAVVTVAVPGGLVAVTLRPDGAVLTGPAEIVATGDWLA